MNSGYTDTGSMEGDEYSVSATQARAPHQAPGPKVSYGGLFEFYAISRLLGYWFEVEFKPVQKLLSNHLLKHDKEFQGWHAAHKAASETVAQHAAAGTGSLSADRLNALEIKTHNAERMQKRIDAKMERASTLTSRGEAVLLASWTAANFVRDRNRLRQNLSLAAAAEEGKHPDSIGLSALTHSKNPIIQSAMHRFWILNAMRFASDAGFLVGLKTGVLGKTADIVLERAFAGDKDAYNMIRIAVNRVEGNYLGGVASQHAYTKSALVETLQMALHRARKDQKWAPATQEQVQALAPALDRVAEAVIARKMKVREVVYVMGKAAVNIDNPARVNEAVDKVLSFGLRRIATPAPAAETKIQPQAPFTHMAGKPLDQGTVEAILARGPAARGEKAHNAGWSLN